MQKISPFVELGPTQLTIKLWLFMHNNYITQLMEV